MLFFRYGSNYSSYGNFKPKDHIITDSDLYGEAIRLFDNISIKNRIEFSHIDCTKDEIELYINENTKAIYIETSTNPMMNVIDIKKVSEISKNIICCLLLTIRL